MSTVNNVYEILGKETCELRLLREEYANLLGLVARLKARSLTLEEVRVNLSEQTWNLVPPPAKEPAAATTDPPATVPFSAPSGVAGGPPSS